MKRYMSAMLPLLAMAASAAVAQQPVAQSSHNPVLKSSDTKRVVGPAHGVSSFTRGQAQGRLAKAGYTTISALTKDGSGAWMANAMKGGKHVKVALDYKGNVTVR